MTARRRRSPRGGVSVESGAARGRNSHGIGSPMAPAAPDAPRRSARGTARPRRSAGAGPAPRRGQAPGGGRDILAWEEGVSDAHGQSQAPVAAGTRGAGGTGRPAKGWNPGSSRWLSTCSTSPAIPTRPSGGAPGPSASRRWGPSQRRGRLPVAEVGDINNDGFADFVIGAPTVVPSTAARDLHSADQSIVLGSGGTGQVYLVFGSSDATARATFNFAQPRGFGSGSATWACWATATRPTRSTTARASPSTA